MTIVKRFAVIAAILVLCVGCDQGTKVLATQYLAGTGTLSLLGGVVRLQYSENTGAMLSLGARLPDWARFWMFGVFVGAVLVALFLYVLRDGTLGLSTVIALSLVLGGGVSNLIDRLSHAGAVIDFMNLGIGGLRTGIFNVADVAIFGGVGLFLWGRLRQPAHADQTALAANQGNGEAADPAWDRLPDSDESAPPDEGGMPDP
jgi:signal peptidase II